MRGGAGRGPAKRPGRLSASTPEPPPGSAQTVARSVGDADRWDGDGTGAGRAGERRGPEGTCAVPDRPGSPPEAINKPSSARRSRRCLQRRPPPGLREHRSVYKSALEQTRDGCEKRFRSIKFLPVTRCQNIPSRPRPGWGRVPEPAGGAAPPPRRGEECGSPGAPPISCLQPFVWEEGSSRETKRRRARREERAALLRGSRAPAELGKLARATAFPFQRK